MLYIFFTRLIQELRIESFKCKFQANILYFIDRYFSTSEMIHSRTAEGVKGCDRINNELTI